MRCGVYATIIKKSANEYTILDVYYKGIWQFKEKHLQQYLSLLNTHYVARFKGETFKDDSCVDEEVIKFVREEKMPLLCNFDPAYISSHLANFTEGIITPPTPIIEVTPYCNYKCPWCYIPTRDQSVKSFSPKDFEEKVVKPMVSRFGLSEWCLTGGEPSLDKDRTILFANIITRVTKKILNKNPLNIYLLTNGYNLEQNAEAFYNAGINRFQVALTSSIRHKEISLRCPPKPVDSLAHAVAGLKKLKEIGARAEVNMIVQPPKSKPCSNIDDIEAMFELAHSLRLDMLRIIPAVPTGKALENGIFFTRAEYKYIGDTVRKMRPLVEKEMFVDCPIDQPIEADRSVYCRAGTLWLYINYKGETFPCNNLQNDDSRCSSSLEQYDVASTWLNSDILKSMRDYEKKTLHDDCVGCSDRAACAGECRALCYARYRTFDLSNKPDKCFKFQIERRRI